MDQAIVIVSFGTYDEEAMKGSIDALEEEVKVAFPMLLVYSALMRSREHRKDGFEKKRLSLEEVLEELIVYKIKEVYLQPTFVTDGNQYQEMVRGALRYQAYFKKMVFGKPLLFYLTDYQEVITSFVAIHGRTKRDEAAVCMGHGESGKLCTQFIVLEQLFKQAGFLQYYVATIRSDPGMEELLEAWKGMGYRKVKLYPFMFCSGYHVREETDLHNKTSWRRVLLACGYEVTCDKRGLGEYLGIRRIYIRHVREMLGIEYKEEMK